MKKEGLFGKRQRHAQPLFTTTGHGIIPIFLSDKEIIENTKAPIYGANNSMFSFFIIFYQYSH